MSFGARGRRRVTVVVTCVGGRLIYDILCGLRAAEDFDVYLVGVDSDAAAHGRLLCDKFVVLPNAREAPVEWSAGMRKLLHESAADALVSLSDAETRIIAAEHATFLATGARCSVGNPAAVPVMVDKLALLGTLAARDVDVGPYHAVDSEADLTEALAALGYPKNKIVLKPRGASGSRGVCILDASIPEFRALLPNRFCGTGERAAVMAAMSAANMGLQGLIAVPYYDGPVYDLDVIARAGVATDICARLRQLRNPLWPTSTGHKIDQNPVVLNYAASVVQALEVDGAADLDIILAAGTTPRVIDAGARFSGSVGGAFTAGANFPAQLVRALLGLPRQRLTPNDGTVLRPYLTMASIPPANEADYL